MEDTLVIQTVNRTPSKKIGPRIAIFPYRSFGKREYFFYVILGIIAVSLPLSYGMNRLYYGYAKFGVVAAHSWARPWFVIAGFALISFLLLMVHRMRLASRFIAIHDQGIFLSLSVPAEYRWEQLAGISASVSKPNFLGRKLRHRYKATIYPNVGKPIRLTDIYTHFPEFLTHFKAKFYPRILPVLKTSYKAGQWVYFGPIAIHKDKLAIRKRQYQWSEVQLVSINEGRLVVEWANREKMNIPVARIPNVEILLQMIDTGVIE